MKAPFALFLTTILVPALHAQVLPNDAIVGGKTIGDWAAEGWQWLLCIPTNQNPNLDPDGARAHVNQPDGPVFFVGGLTQISTVIERSFTVPEGKHLFVPLISAYVDNFGVVPPLTVEEMRAQASNLAPKRQQPLLASLNAARASFDAGHLSAVIGQLNAFQNKVCEKVEPLDEGLAGNLVQSTQRIIERAQRDLGRPHSTNPEFAEELIRTSKLIIGRPRHGLERLPRPTKETP